MESFANSLAKIDRFHVHAAPTAISDKEQTAQTRAASLFESTEQALIELPFKIDLQRTMQNEPRSTHKASFESRLAEVMQNAEKRLQADNVRDLPNIKQYSAKKTAIVHQAEAQIFVPGNDQVDGLYTFGAGPCLILVAVSRDAIGNVKNVGMTHIDAGVEDESIDLFFQKMEKPINGAVEATVISGIRRDALRVLRASDRAGAKMVFASADFYEQREDAAAVDRNGQVYYGNSFSLNCSTDSRKADVIFNRT